VRVDSFSPQKDPQKERAGLTYLPTSKMPKLIVFNHSSIDGYIADANGDMSWAKLSAEDAEWNAFVEENTSGSGALLFGRVTYDLMRSFWPTPQAAQQMPAVAARMNRSPKVVFSRTLETVAWQNTTLVRGDIAAAVRKMKQESMDMAILGSGSIVAQLAPEGLIDEFQIVMNPIALGAGKTMFEGMTSALRLRLLRSRTFQNGYVLLTYSPAA
jgi:dihydrofolate reductase